MKTIYLYITNVGTFDERTIAFYSLEEAFKFGEEDETTEILGPVVLYENAQEARDQGEVASGLRLHAIRQIPCCDADQGEGNEP